MPLNRSQKRYIKHHIREHGVETLSKNLKIREEEIRTYLKDVWGEEKYNRVLSQAAGHDKPKSLFPSVAGDLATLSPAFIVSSLIFLFILVGIAYFNSLNNAFVSDDNGIPQTRNLGDISYVLSTGYAFLRPFFYFVIYHIGGLAPIFYRMLNIFIHVGSTWLVFLILVGMTSPVLALLTAILFAVHPIIVESITWISGGGYAQYTFFFLLALYLYMKSDKRPWTYPLSVVSFVCSMVSSPAAASLTLMFPMYEWFFGNIKKNWWKSIAYFLSMGTLALPFVLNIGTRLDTFKTGYYQDSATYNPLFQIPVALSSYLELMLWPDKLTLYHTELAFTVTNFIVRVIVVFLYFVLLAVFFKKNKLLFFWLSLFVISLLPTLTPYRVAWIVAERYVYAGAIGIFFGAAYLFYRAGLTKTGKYLSYGLFLIVVVALLTRTIIRNVDWTNEDTLWFATARTSPSSWVNHNNLGDVYARRGEYDKSLKEFETAIKMNPRYADAYNNMANIYGRLGKVDLAIEYYTTALKLNPTIWQSHENLGAIYFDLKNYDLAESHMREAIRINPNVPPLFSNLGIILLTKKDVKGARAAFEQALSLDPANQAARLGLEDLSKIGQ